MSNITPEQIADAIVAKLKEGQHTFWIDPEVHSNQHEFIRTLIEERAEKLARRKRLEDKIAGSLILSAILVALGFLGAGALEWLREHLK